MQSTNERLGFQSTNERLGFPGTRACSSRPGVHGGFFWWLFAHLSKAQLPMAPLLFEMARKIVFAHSLWWAARADVVSSDAEPRAHWISIR